MAICSGDHFCLSKLQTWANKALANPSLGAARQNKRRRLRLFCANVQLYRPDGALRCISRLMLEGARLSIRAMARILKP